MAATTATAKLGARNLQHFNTGCFQLSVGIVIAVVTDDYAGTNRQHVP